MPKHLGYDFKSVIKALIFGNIFSWQKITNMATSKFANVESAPPIEVFALNKAYVDDTFPQKVNLGVGGIHFK